MGGGGTLKARPEGYHREVAALQRLHDKLRMDSARDPDARARIMAALSSAIADLNALADRELARAAPQSNGKRNGKSTPNVDS